MELFSIRIQRTFQLVSTVLGINHNKIPAFHKKWVGELCAFI